MKYFDLSTASEKDASEMMEEILSADVRAIVDFFNNWYSSQRQYDYNEEDDTVYIQDFHWNTEERISTDEFFNNEVRETFQEVSDEDFEDFSACYEMIYEFSLKY